MKSMVFLWYVVWDRACVRVRDDTCLTIKRLLLRLENEITTLRPLLEKMKKLHSQEGASVSEDRLSMKEKEKLKRLQAVQNRLETSVLRLARSFAVLTLL